MVIGDFSYCNHIKLNCPLKRNIEEVIQVPTYKPLSSYTSLFSFNVGMNKDLWHLETRSVPIFSQNFEKPSFLTDFT